MFSAMHHQSDGTLDFITQHHINNNNNDSNSSDKLDVVKMAAAAASGAADTAAAAAASAASFPAARIKTQPPDFEDSGSERSSPKAGNSAAAAGTSGAAAATTDVANQIVGAGQEAYLSSDETAQFEADKRLIYKWVVLCLTSIFVQCC